MAGATVDSLEIQIEANAADAGKSIDLLCSKFSTLQNGLGKIGSSSNTSFAKLKNNVNGLNNVFKSTETSTKLLARTFGNVYIKVRTLETAFRGLGKTIESSMNYVETSNFWQVALDKIGADFGKYFEQYGYDSAESYVNSFSERLKALNKKMTGYVIGESGEANLTDDIELGVDVEKLMNFQAQVMSVTNSVGLMGESSISTAKALSMLSSDLSSLTNTDLSTVMTNLQSGLLGQSRALYKYGIDITNATLQNYAYANGISKVVSAMTQSEKMQLRVLAILDQSKIAWGDQINTINSVSNQFRILQQQFSNLARTIGNLFLPVVAKVLPYLNAFVILANRAFTALGSKLFGGDWLKNIQSGISGGSISGLEDVEEGAEGSSAALDKASKSAKKFKGQLHKIDELNVLTSNSDSSTGDGVSSTGGASFDLSETIGDSLAEYESVWDAAIANSQNKAQELADKISEAFSSNVLVKIGAVVGVVGTMAVAFNKVKNVVSLLGAAFAKTKLGETIALWAGRAGTLSESFAAVFGVSLPLVAALTGLAVGLGYVYSKNEQVRQGFADAVAMLKEGLQPAMNFISNTVIPDLKGAWNGLLKVLEPLGKFLEGVFTDIWMEIINPALTYVGKTVIPEVTKCFETFWKKILVPLGEFLASVFKPIISTLSDVFTVLWQEVVLPLAEAIGGFLGDAFEALVDVLNNNVYPAVGFVIDSFTFLMENVFNPLSEVLWQTILPVFRNVFGEVTKVVTGLINTFSGLLSFITGVFSGNWNRAWEGITKIFSGLWQTLSSSVKIPINAMIGMFEGLANGIITGFNAVKRAINKLNFEIPDWVPKYGGKSIGFNLAETPKISIKRFASGGFPEDGWFRANHGEIMGKFDNGQSVVANNMQITEGISAAVYKGNRENNALIRQQIGLLQRQNELLLGILEKETGISSDDIFRSVRKSANDYFNKTGDNPFWY